ncbi:hypothetical protein [Alcaligenes aquatilis]|uniref:Type I restriction endonuclease subunit M n=1 Tax=Alcaligenes aquatilis TaxID=323284 RepID=A0A3G2HR20_9BURK|nr:hypothetical protein [Alcaligenes aquatilis]AYN19572.1 hypothetical protein D3M96_02880 [Alcaligenes aquatilis]
MASGILFLNPTLKPRFEPGQAVITMGVETLIQQGRIDPAVYLSRHLDGDWGDLNACDRQQNNAALQSGKNRLFSSYQIAPDLKLLIITEWDRSVTTLLLPSEY